MTGTMGCSCTAGLGWCTTGFSSVRLLEQAVSMTAKRTSRRTVRASLTQASATEHFWIHRVRRATAGEDIIDARGGQLGHARARLDGRAADVRREDDVVALQKQRMDVGLVLEYIQR